MSTIRNPQSPFPGGISRSFYSKAEEVYRAFIVTVSELDNAALIAAAATAAAAANQTTEAGVTALGELWAYNHELRKRRLPQVTISA